MVSANEPVSNYVFKARKALIGWIAKSRDVKQERCAVGNLLPIQLGEQRSEEDVKKYKSMCGWQT